VECLPLPRDMSNNNDGSAFYVGSTQALNDYGEHVLQVDRRSSANRYLVAVGDIDGQASHYRMGIGFRSTVVTTSLVNISVIVGGLMHAVCRTTRLAPSPQQYQIKYNYMQQSIIGSNLFEG
jgi:hypothetical protein